MSLRGKKWSEMSTPQRVAVVALGVAEVALAAVAITDLARRPAAQVRGKKWMWGPAMSVNLVGPLAYLLFGRVVPGSRATGAEDATLRSGDAG